MSPARPRGGYVSNIATSRRRSRRRPIRHDRAAREAPSGAISLRCPISNVCWKSLSNGLSSARRLMTKDGEPTSDAPKCPSAEAKPARKAARSDAVMSTRHGTGRVLRCSRRSCVARARKAGEVPPCANQICTARRQMSNCCSALPSGGYSLRIVASRRQSSLRATVQFVWGAERPRLGDANSCPAPDHSRKPASNGVLSARSLTPSAQHHDAPALFSRIMKEPSQATNPEKKATSGGSKTDRRTNTCSYTARTVGSGRYVIER